MPRGLFRDVALSAGLVLLVTLIKLAVPPLGRQLPFLLFFAATLSASWYGGPRCGWLATLFSAAAGNVLFLPPALGPSLAPSAIFQTAVFFAECSAFVVLVGQVRATAGARDHALEEARAQREQLDEILKSEQDARARAEEASRTKDEFLAVVSHELRTPLNAMLGWGRMLKTGGLPPAKQERALDAIERNAVAQAQLIEDLLDVTRITTGKLRLDVERVELAGAVRAASESLKPALDAKRIQLEQATDDVHVAVSGDPSRLQQAIWNLLSNAIKFTPEGGSVSMRTSTAHGRVAITVKDTGQGIEPEFLPHVFQRFRQAETGTKRRHGGLGLGLSITRHIVELHGGTIEVESEGAGKGTAFTITLPIAPEVSPVTPRAPLAEADGPTSELAGLRVLVVDDQEDTGDLVAEILREAGADPVAVTSAEAAVAAIATRRPDVIVSDIGMPGEDGYELIRRVRALPREEGGDIPAAALTAYARAEDRKRALVAGFHMHAAKPVEPAELLSVVTNLARMAR